MARTPEQQAAVDEASRGLADVLAQPTAPEQRASLDYLIRAYAVAREKREAAGAEEKRLRVIEDDAERELFDALEQQGLHSIRHELGQFILNDQAWSKVVDPIAARGWAEEHAPDLITLNVTRLNPTVRNALKEGLELPPGVEYSIKRSIQWRGRE